MNWLRSKELTLYLFGIATIAWAIWMNPDGYAASDEAIYHMMTLTLVEDGNLFIWNGYEEFPSPELVPSLARAHQGHLYPQYPVYYSAIAYPFIFLLGFKGFYLLNAISLLAATFVCYRLAKLLFHDADLAKNSSLILLFATFAWEYGQTAWPHTVSVLLVTISTYLATVAYRSSGVRGSLVASFGAGLVAGLGVGVRLDMILVLPALVVPFLFVSPWRPREAFAIGAGAIPGLGVLTLTNYLKFGVVSPLSYGQVPTQQIVFESYIPIIMAGLGGLAVTWLATRQYEHKVISKRRVLVACVLIFLAGTAFAIPDLWVHVSRLANGAYKLLVDLGIEGTQARSVGDDLSLGGAPIIMGTVGKAFLQSCPYLAALAIPTAALVRGSEDRGQVSVLFLIPGVFIFFYSYFFWYGVEQLNLRYFLPVLPFTSILCAYAWRELNRRLSSQWYLPQLIVMAATAIVFTILMVTGHLSVEGTKTLANQTIMFGVIPLVIFAVLLGLMLLVLIFGTKTPRWVRGTSSLVLIGAFAWSGMTAFENDYLRSYLMRNKRANLDAQLARVVEPNSIIFANTQNSFYRLWVDHRVRIAVPWYDDFKDFHALREFHSKHFRATYVWLNEGMEGAIKEHRLFDDLETVQILDLPGRGSLVQIVERAGRDAALPSTSD